MTDVRGIADPRTPAEDDSEGTRILTVSAVLNALDALKDEVGGHAAAVAEMLAQQEAAKAARHEARQELLRRLRDEPHKFDFFQAVRLLENAHPGLPRIGTSLRLRDDPIRFAQSPSLSFAPAALVEFRAGRRRLAAHAHAALLRPVRCQRPAAAAPDRVRARTGAAHAVGSRAGALPGHVPPPPAVAAVPRLGRGPPAVSLDRPDNDPFSRWVGSLAGYGQPTLIGRDAVPDGARLAAAGILGRSVHGAEGLERILNDFFRVPVRVHQWQPHWMRLPEDAHSRIGLRNAPVALGQNARRSAPRCGTARPASASRSAR